MTKKVSLGKVFVGLSGGVDSSVSAALLQSQGYEVVGVFIKVWQPDFYVCNWKEDRLDAMRICAKLKIPFYTLDLEKEYKEEVVDYMINEYRIGRTPNPDVMCNRFIKFGGFFDWAIKNGADYVATGHYARIKKEKDIYQMMTGKDKNKDQSYFLWTLNQRQLAKTIFPIGNLEKPQVRKLAKKFDLPTVEKKDSQGLCFIGKVEMADFLKHFIKLTPGDVLNKEGQKIGYHDGSILYTIGQRHGFTIVKNSPNNHRNFVVAKDIKNNTITISDNLLPNNSKLNKEIMIKEINWQSGKIPDLTKEYYARIRYRQPLEKCRLFVQEDKVLVRFLNNQKAPTPGQSVVIYDKEICLGGGIIE